MYAAIYTPRTKNTSTFLKTVTLLGINSTNPAIPASDVVFDLYSDPAGLVFIPCEGDVSPLSPNHSFMHTQKQPAAGDTAVIIPWPHIDSCMAGEKYEEGGCGTRLMTFVGLFVLAMIVGKATPDTSQHVAYAIQQLLTLIIGLSAWAVAFYLFFMRNPRISTIVITAWNEDFRYKATYSFAVSAKWSDAPEEATRLVRIIWAERGKHWRY